MASPLTGAWELISDTDVAIAIYMDTHFSFVSMQKDRKGFQGAQPTQDEIVDAYNTSRSLAGTYSVSGNRVTHHRIANQRPELMGIDLEMEFSIEGDTLNAKILSGAGVEGAELVYKKVG